MTIDDILGIASPARFEAAALELFAVQAAACAPYAEYLRRIGVDPAQVDSVDKIPCLPISLFKTHKVYCGTREPEAIFTSSTTGGSVPSRHYVERVADYERTCLRAFSLFYGEPVPLFALLPSYLERGGSSLVWMARKLIEAGGGDFYLDDYDALLRDMVRTPGPKILLGVSYALWDLAEKHPGKLADTIVMETGGMKGRREELPREELHKILCTAFGVGTIHSEYGMAELSSQAYSPEGGIFRAPPWMRVAVRDASDPFDIKPPGSTGAVNIIDLANLSSCAFIQTDDLGHTYPDGRFTILGRRDRSESRGCNLLIQ